MEEISNYSEDLTGQTLDHEDWEGFRRLSHSALDDAIGYLRDVRQRPPVEAGSRSDKAELTDPATVRTAECRRHQSPVSRKIFLWLTGNIHSRFWGWVHGTGTATSILSDMRFSGVVLSGIVPRDVRIALHC